MATETAEQKHNALQQQLNGAAAFISLATAFVGLKLLARRFRADQRTVLTCDDGLLLASLVAFIPMCAFAIVDARAYMAYYSTTDRASRMASLTMVAKSDYAISVTYPVASVLPKLSLCVLYLRIFSIDLWSRRITQGTIVFLILNAIAWLVPTIRVCYPISVFWDLKRSHDCCLNYNLFGTWISFPNIVTDLVMLLLPMPVLYRMHMATPKKLGLLVTFLAGSVGIVGACLRLAFYVHRTYVQRPGADQSTRKFMSSTNCHRLTTAGSIAYEVITTYLECGMYLIAACLPSLRPLIVRCHSMLSSSFGSILQRYRHYGAADADGSPSADEGSHEAKARQRIDVKLTGIGDCDTLVHAGENYNMSRVDSGFFPSNLQKAA
ncbi:MAG: hypothetical protein Q9162_004395 [Coniocarpon cinnabarinum]